MTNIARYKNGHLFSLFGKAPRTALVNQLAAVLGGVNADDLANVEKFADRVRRLSRVAHERNCKLYVDAEQSFIQAAIESFGQQMTHELNRGDKTIVMNGYQCYLKRMKALIPMEVRASKDFGHHLGVKLIRGAYMNEERNLAEEHGVESPVWDSLDETHACYNASMEHIIRNLKDDD